MRVVGRDPVAQEQQASSHPEVNQENPTRFEPNNQILSAALERLDRLPYELGGDLTRVVGTGQARVCDLDLLEGAADEVGLETDSDRLDLGQLGHVLSVASAGCG